MFLLGYDLGSSSIKASIVDIKTGKTVCSEYFPKEEMKIFASQPGWAEQNPEMWWTNLKSATKSLIQKYSINSLAIQAIGISYQMHGLVLVDAFQKVLRPSIIWCDSRAVPYGEKALASIGKEKVLSNLLNSPGNFTASKLAWVKEHEPDIYSKIYKIMLPGDYIAMKLTGEITTTIEGLSEGIFWDFRKNRLSDDIFDYFGFSRDLIPELKPTFGIQGRVSAEAAKDLKLKTGIPVSYRAGDQPNNALSLNVLNPGEIASTAGTSGVVYGVLDSINYDRLSRVNTFAHVNHVGDKPRLGVLLCINGTGILNSWVKRNMTAVGTTYDEMNMEAKKSLPGARGICVIPFGNGSERILGNNDPGCSFHGINFNIHDRSDILRAGQEGIVFSFRYGMDIMKEMGMNINVIRAGNSNMFLSQLFRESLATVSNTTIELYDTDGASGAAKGAGIGAGIYSGPEQAFRNLKKLDVVEPSYLEKDYYEQAYQKWKSILEKTNN